MWRAAPLGQRRAQISAHVREHALHTLALDPDTSLSPKISLKEVGLNSLMAVELRNSLTRSVGRSLPATLLFDYPSVDALASYLMRVLELAGEAEPATVSTIELSAAAIAELSDEEADAQLLAELEGLPQRAIS